VRLPRRLYYEHLLAKTEPGMTRRGLYQILPPQHTPTASLPVLFSVDERLYFPHTERHPLDHDFFLAVEYRLARLREYPLPLAPPGRHARMNLMGLLTGPANFRSLPSCENAKDQLFRRPILCEGEASLPVTFDTTDFRGLSIPHPHPAKAKVADGPLSH